MGINLSDLRLTNGKYYYDDLEGIRNKFVKNNEELEKALQSRTEFLKGYTGEEISWTENNVKVTRKLETKSILNNKAL